MSDERVILTATFTARPGEADRVADLIREYGEFVRTEPGNVVFDVSRLREVPEKFFVYEIYRDEAVFQAHLDTEEGRVFNEDLTPLIVEPHSDLTFLVAV
ncbi:putative quinol monooxygenase [Ruania alba]|uniref:Quinol monooxygenase YgiN n=1 Tax=Ruania alba TaxID=648782 RepID=A0A1H5CAC6_9MICO|nr:putative quinol monooxygenase [Ruania alba]SED63753.1 Quinol monooxygenase YgiN [Ruania alba]